MLKYRTRNYSTVQNVLLRGALERDLDLVAPRYGSVLMDAKVHFMPYNVKAEWHRDFAEAGGVRHLFALHARFNGWAIR